ncbi:glutathione S-transferase family protein [Mesorhizobium sp. AaZ16]|uniref:glutathione S-transferase family protein n=1 Tax=Mesorhizobium sp. AaZ16 TaxID=3402289 RepID=UPI00374F0C3A
MALKLYYHPLASFCWKALIALYETGTPFEPRLVDLGDPDARAQFLKLWPIGKFPVLRDEAKGLTIPESTIIIEYLARHHPGEATLLPMDHELAWRTRLKDRFYDLYVHEPMQKIVTDRLRPAGRNDPHGVELARAQLTTSYAMIEREMAERNWAVGDNFGMADCAAAPALFYANKVAPFGGGHPHVARYLGRLKERLSFARVLEEAKPYFKMFPEQNAS